MNKRRLSACCFFVASAGFFITSMTGFSSGNSMAIVWFVLACSQLALGCAHYSKYKQELKDEENQKKMDSFHNKRK